MRLATNFHFLYAAVWTAVVIAYLCRWSNLNQPLDPQLTTFLIVTVACSAFLGAMRMLSRHRHVAFTHRAQPGNEKRMWLITGSFACGFAADFAFRGGIPLATGTYSGYDITTAVQATVGIPVVHVILVAGSIFYAVLLVERFSSTRSRSYMHQFTVILALLLLNNSRGYMTFCVLGAIMIILSTSTRDSRSKRPFQTFVLAGGILYCLLIGIGIFGNIRSGLQWNDTSYITAIGRYNDSWPTILNDNIKWTYTYLTSSLANLNYNISTFAGSGSALHSIAAFVPETFTKYALAEQLDVRYQVTYLNASTGYVGAYYIGGGITGLYVSYAIQLVVLEAGAAITRALGQAELLYATCASIVTIVFVFYNSYANTATCLLLPLSVCVAFLRHRARLRDHCEDATTNQARTANRMTARRH